MKLHVTPKEAWEILEKNRQCEIGLDRYDEAEWVQWMQARFGIAPFREYEMVVHWDLTEIPSGAIDRTSE